LHYYDIYYRLKHISNVNQARQGGVKEGFEITPGEIADYADRIKESLKITFSKT